MLAGTCCTSDLYPSRELVLEQRSGVQRVLIYDVNPLDRVCDEVGVPVIALMNNECAQVGRDWSGWQSAIEMLAERANGRVIAVECGNELDALEPVNPKKPNGPKKPRATPAEAAALVVSASGTLRDAGIACLTTSVVSEHWEAYLKELAKLTMGHAVGVTFHPYGKRPQGWTDSPGWGFGDLLPAIATAYEAGGGLPVWITEIGIKIGEAGGADGMARFAKAAVETCALSAVVPAMTYFCFQDGIGSPGESGDSAFGLIDHGWQKRPAFYSFASACQALGQAGPGEPQTPDTPDPPPITWDNATGFDRWYQSVEVRLAAIERKMAGIAEAAAGP